MPYQLSARADGQLTEILIYTAERFGRRQAEVYAAKLAERIEAALNLPALMRANDDILPGLLSIRAESHIVYGSFQGGVFYVAAILHQRMEPRLHLRNDD